MTFCVARGLAHCNLVSTGLAVDGGCSASGMLEQLGCGLRKKMSDLRVEWAFMTACGRLDTASPPWSI
jgi:hypothetical protein